MVSKLSKLSNFLDKSRDALRERIFVVAYSNRLVKTRRREVPIAWTRQIGSSIESVVQSRQFTGEADSRGIQFPSEAQGVAPGIFRGLDQFGGGGWWRENPFRGPVAAPAKTIPDRLKRISALGDTVCHRQAMIPLMRVKYLNEFYRGEKSGNL